MSRTELFAYSLSSALFLVVTAIAAAELLSPYPPSTVTACENIRSAYVVRTDTAGKERAICVHGRRAYVVTIR